MKQNYIIISSIKNGIVKQCKFNSVEVNDTISQQASFDCLIN